MFHRLLKTILVVLALFAIVFISTPKTFAATQKSVNSSSACNGKKCNRYYQIHSNVALAPACTYAKCNGKDPYTTHCADTSDVNNPLYAEPVYDYNGNPVGTLYNLYSSGCKANWAQVWFNTTQYDANLAIINPSATVLYCIPANCSSFTLTIPGGSGAWTDMIDGGPVNSAQIGTSTVPLFQLNR